MKRFFNLLSALALVVLMQGCGGAPSVEPEIPDNPQTNVESKDDSQTIVIADAEFEIYLLEEPSYPTPEEAEIKAETFGFDIDANGDGIVDIIDMALIKRHIVGSQLITI